MCHPVLKESILHYLVYSEFRLWMDRFYRRLVGRKTTKTDKGDLPQIWMFLVCAFKELKTFPQYLSLTTPGKLFCLQISDEPVIKIKTVLKILPAAYGPAL